MAAVCAVPSGPASRPCPWCWVEVRTCGRCCWRCGSATGRSRRLTAVAGVSCLLTSCIHVLLPPIIPGMSLCCVALGSGHCRSVVSSSLCVCWCSLLCCVWVKCGQLRGSDWLSMLCCMIVRSMHTLAVACRHLSPCAQRHVHQHSILDHYHCDSVDFVMHSV